MGMSLKLCRDRPAEQCAYTFAVFSIMYRKMQLVLNSPSILHRVVSFADFCGSFGKRDM